MYSLPDCEQGQQSRCPSLLGNKKDLYSFFLVISRLWFLVRQHKEDKTEEKITFFEVMIQSRCSVIGTGMNGRLIKKLYLGNLPLTAT